MIICNVLVGAFTGSYKIRNFDPISDSLDLALLKIEIMSCSFTCFSFAEIPQRSSYNTRVRLRCIQAHRNSSWTNNRGPLWNRHLRDVAKSPPFKAYSPVGPNNRNCHTNQQNGHPHDGPSPRWDGRAPERWLRKLVVYGWIQRKGIHVDQRNVSLRQPSTTWEPMVP